VTVDAAPSEEDAMGNRSRFIALTSAAAGVAGMRSLARKRRRARLRRAAEGIAETVMPSVAAEMPSVAMPRPVGDDAHAPGHRHLSTDAFDDEPAPPPVRSRPFAKQRHGLRHPGKG
jgi:hypothetical protein